MKDQSSSSPASFNLYGDGANGPSDQEKWKQVTNAYKHSNSKDRANKGFYMKYYVIPFWIFLLVSALALVLSIL